MEPKEIGTKYDKIAQWWHHKHFDSRYGVEQIERALAFVSECGSALDIGCGAGGRLIRRLEDHGFAITGIDISAEMIELAAQNHPGAFFYVHDICTWETGIKYDFIVAWDSIFHLPLKMHRPVIAKIAYWLEEKGVLIYTFGNATGEHTDTWHDDQFYYSSIGINGNLTALIENGLTIMHVELDQYPEKHVCVIAQKP
jgi:SAM-dependent methyltransferase